MKLKKCLLTGFSLGLSAITIGAVVSSCASPAVEATDPNPASANSLTTNPGDPLTPQQQDYQQKLAAEIKVQFDANASLDYSVPADKANIGNQIAEYEKSIDNNVEYVNFIKQFTAFDSALPTNETDSVNLSINFYDNFKQKNLLATEQEITNYITSIGASQLDATKYWKTYAIWFGLIYVNPKSFILLAQLSAKIAYNQLDGKDIYMNNSILNCKMAYEEVINKNFLTKTGPAYLGLKYYQPFLLEINNLINPTI